MNKSILDIIGNTPLVRLKNDNDKGSKLFAKLEMMNPNGSMKDRVSLNIISNAIASGKLKKGDTVIESSSGNMGIALAQICAYYELNLIIVTDPNANKINLSIIESFGGQVIVVQEKCVLNGWHGSRINKVRSLIEKNPNLFWTDQYTNKLNPQAHEQTMKEILVSLDGDLDYIFVSASTCGTLMGCAAAIEEMKAKTKVIAVDAEGSVLFRNQPGSKRIPGHGSSQKSAMLDQSKVYKVIHVSDENCVRGAKELVKEQAILAGGSSGGAYYAAKKFIEENDSAINCAIILCDRGERYLDTIYNENWLEAKVASVNSH